VGAKRRTKEQHTCLDSGVKKNNFLLSFSIEKKKFKKKGKINKF
jgi:hypothetical protein